MIVVVTAVLEKPAPPGIVTVIFSPLGFVAVTPAPTKSKETAAVERDEPSFLTVMSEPPPDPIDEERTVNFSSRYFPT